MVREVRVLVEGADGNSPDFASGYLVTVLEVGAQVSAVYDGSGVPVRAGHGFAAGDKFIVQSEFPATTKLRTVTSTTSTKLFCATVDVAVGDVLINLGADTETVAGTPDYTSPGLTVYSDMALTQAVTYNTVATDANGRARYYHNGISRWELVRAGATLITVYQDTDTQGVGTPNSVTDNHVVRWDGSDGHNIQDGSPVVISDAGAISGLTSIAASGAVTAASVATSGSVTSGGTLVASAAATVATTLAVAGTSTLAAVNASGTVAAAGAVTVGTTLGVTGNATLSANLFKSVATVTASTTHTQVGATALTKDVNNVSVCANADDAVALPSAVAGMQIIVCNNGAQNLRIWPASGDNLGTGVDTVRAALAAGSNAKFTAIDGTSWEEI